MDRFLLVYLLFFKNRNFLLLLGMTFILTKELIQGCTDSSNYPGQRKEWIAVFHEEPEFCNHLYN